MKRKEQKERTRTLLFDIALSLFMEKGYENVSVDFIAKTAGVSKGAFYHHFISKEAILVDYLNSILNKLSEDILDIVKKEKNADKQEIIEGIGRSISAFYFSNMTTLSMLMEESNQHNLSVQEVFTREISPIITAVLMMPEKKREAELRVKAERLATYITTLIFLELKTLSSDQKQRVLDNKIYGILDVFFKGMFIDEQ